MTTSPHDLCPDDYLHHPGERGPAVPIYEAELAAMESVRADLLAAMADFRKRQSMC